MEYTKMLKEALQKGSIHLKGNPDSLSMSPLIVGDNLLEVVKVDSLQDLTLGDIAVMDFGDVYVCHRIIQIDRLRCEITTKGDNNYGQDFPIKLDKLIGKVNRVIYKEYTIELSYPFNKKLAQWITRISRKCNLKSNYYRTDLSFALLRIAVILGARANRRDSSESRYQIREEGI